jgi:hypothetical protein
MLSLLIKRREYYLDTTRDFRPIDGPYYDDAITLTGCGGQDTTPTEEKEANVEEAAPDESPPDEAPVEALPAYEPGQDTDTEICQTGEALQDLGPEGLQGLTDELSEEVSAGRFANMQEALVSRGYTCNGQAR